MDQLTYITSQLKCEIAQVLDDYIKNSGSQEGGNYFLGGAYSIADVYTGPLLYLGSTWVEAFRDYDLFAEARKQKLDRFVSWAEVRPSSIVRDMCLCMLSHVLEACHGRVHMPSSCRCVSTEQSALQALASLNQ